MPELYDHILDDRCYTVRLLLSLLGAPYTKRAVDFAPAKRPVSAAVLSLNPKGELPVLVDGDEVLTDLTAILVHVCAQYDQADTWQATDDGIRVWLEFATGPLLAVSEARRIRLFNAPGELDPLIGAARRALRRLEDHLTDRALFGQQFIVARMPTLADIAAFPAVALCHDCGIGHEDYPALNLWQRRIRSLPGFVAMPGIPSYF